MIGEVNDVVDQVTVDGDLEVGDGPVVDGESALVTVEIQKAAFTRVLLKLLRLGQDADDAKVVLTAFVDEVPAFTLILNNVPWHPSGQIYNSGVKYEPNRFIF